MNESADRRVVIHVCGEPHRGDDAIAFHAMAQLPDAVSRRVDIVRAGQLDVQHLLDLPLGALCIVIDAVAGIEPGRVWRSELDRLVARAGGQAALSSPQARSTHQLPLEQTLALGQLLRGSPLQGSFVGLGGAHYAVGTTLSPAVAAAIPDFVAAIAAEVESLTAVQFSEAAA